MTQNQKSPVVLIIDDDEVTRFVLERLLKKEAFHVLLAKDGQQGIDLAQQKKPDIILLDIIMPTMDGFEVLAALKRDSALKDVPVCIFSILNREDRKEKAMAMGASGFIPKPFNMKEVVAHVKKWVTKSSSH